jgi:hypothetical protein
MCELFHWSGAEDTGIGRESSVDQSLTARSEKQVNLQVMQHS